MNAVKTFLKKYSALMLPAALVIVAFLLLIPSILIRRGLAQDMQTSIQQSTNLAQLVSRAPTLATVADAGRYMQRYEEEKQAIEDMAVQSTRRELIQYGLFPNPGDTSAQIYNDFGNRFRAATEDLIRLINAKDAPSQAEIENRLGISMNQPAVNMGMMDGRTGMGAAALTSTQDEVVGAVCRERAEQISVYAEPGAFPVYSFWETYRFPGRQQAIKDCWYTQVAYWVYEDVAATIKSINAGSTRVDDSPVKRLLGVRFQGPVIIEGGNMMAGRMGAANMRVGMGGGVSAMDKPIYLAAVQSSTSPMGMSGTLTAGQSSPFLAKSWTGRSGDAENDVVHFAVSAIVDSWYVLSFYEALCSAKPHQYRENYQADGKVTEARHNPITILESSVAAVDPDAPEHTYYRYGSAGVVQVNLVCEYLLNRAGYDSLKPQEIKDEIGQGEAGAGGMQNPGMPVMPGPTGSPRMSDEMF